MKKSKIIIPALSLIAFSVAASVAGAVAWFTASRSAQISAGQYSVVKTSAELQATLSAGVGTVIDTNRDNTIVFNGKLTDGSFNHKTGTVFYPNSEGSAIGGSVALTDSDLASKLERGTTSDNYTIYTAATFDISFTVTFGTDGADIGLYLDNTANKSAFTVSDNSTPITAKGFRMGIFPKTIATGSVGKATVLADLEDDDYCHYIAATSSPFQTGVDYSELDYDLIDSSYNADLPRITDQNTGTLTRATQINRPDYLGYFKFAAQTQVTLVYTVVAWFEGTDPQIVNRANATDYQSVASLLCFEGLNLKPAA